MLTTDLLLDRNYHFRLSTDTMTGSLMIDCSIFGDKKESYLMTQQKSNKAALYLLMFNMFITMGSIGIIIPVMPEYLRIFGAKEDKFLVC